MKIIFKNLILHNFLSFGHAELNLQNKGYTLVSGINNNLVDFAKSNGSGKSSIFSGLCYALTGETIQGLSSNLNNMFNQGDMYVSLDFSIDNDNYKITRSKAITGKADLKILLNGVDISGKGVRESQQILSQRIPELSSDLIGGVIIIGQGMPHRFSNNTPANRKELLETLSNSDCMFTDIKSRLENRLDVIKEIQNNLKIKNTELNTKIELSNRYLAELKDKLTKLLDKSNINYDAEIASCEKLIIEYNNQSQTLTGDYNNKLSEIKTLEDNLRDITNEETNLLNTEKETFNKYNLEIKTNITKYKTEITAITNEIEKLKNIKDICPTCGQKLPHVHKPDTADQESKLQSLCEDLEKAREKDAKQEESFKLNCEDISNNFKIKKDKLNEYLTSAKAVSDKLSQDIKAIDKSLSDTKLQKLSLEKDKDQLESQKTETLESIKKAESDVTKLQEDLLYNIKDIDNNTSHIEVLNKISTLVKRDFRGLLLSNIISYLDAKCKEYCYDIFSTRELSFELNDNNIDISYLGKPLEALSGGEKQKVDLIIQFAIRSMMQEYVGFTSNILVLDEILDNLDSVGCDQVLNFITNKLNDIESIFIISHHADSLNIGNDSEVVVIKDNQGVSSIYEK